MAPKKYLSLEEAAAELGLRADELNRLREKGDVRGFADRGNWKFRGEDIDELKRRLGDSDPEVPIFNADDDDDEDAPPVMKSSQKLPAATPPKVPPKKLSDTALEDDEDLGSQATIIRQGQTPSGSDSDVRLVFDDDLRKNFSGSDPEVPIPNLAASDSDVRLVSDAPPKKKSSDSDVRFVVPPLSDSDVKLSDSDSDVRLASPAPKAGKGKLTDSDSDVKLTKPSGSKTPQSGTDPLMLTSDSDSDVRLPGLKADSDSDVRLPGLLTDSDSDVRLPGSAKSQSTSDSDVRLADSSIKLPPAADPSDSDSEVRLAKTKSSQKMGLSDQSSLRLAGSGKLSPSPASSSTRSPSSGVGKSSSPKSSPAAGSDSEVRLIGNSATGRLPAGNVMSDDDSIDLDADSGQSALFDDDSAITLPGDSGFTLSSESGIQLGRPADSGILLERPTGDDSGFRLSDEDPDSSITLAEDSGIRLSDSPSSATGRSPTGTGRSPTSTGKSPTNTGRSSTGTGRSPAGTGRSPLADDDDFDTGTPMLLMPEDDATDFNLPLLGADDDDDTSATQTIPSSAGTGRSPRPSRQQTEEIPLLLGSDDEIPELGGPGVKSSVKMPKDSRGTARNKVSDLSDDDTGVVLFDDDDVGENQATTVRRGVDDENEGSAFDLEAPSFDDELDTSAEATGDVDVDVFEADDDDFEQGFESGSQELAAVGPVRVAAPSEFEWGPLVLTGLVFSTLLLAVGGVMSVDLLRTVKGTSGLPEYNGGLVEVFSTLFK